MIVIIAGLLSILVIVIVIQWRISLATWQHREDTETRDYNRWP